MTQLFSLPGGLLSIDLEVDPKSNRIFAFAAVNPDTRETLVHDRKTSFTKALANLDHLASGVSCLVGHNLIAHDLPQLEACNPGLKLLERPALDTLMLSPLAFPQNPYHRLIKHYQDGGLIRGQLNDPELDARLALDVLQEEFRALQQIPGGLLRCWHWLTTREPGGAGFDLFFSALRQSGRPDDHTALSAIQQQLDGQGCQTHGREVLERRTGKGWSLAYALAWLSVSGGNSVIPPWVCRQFPETLQIVKTLRDTACADPACHWCRERHDPVKELKRWFGFETFRPEPKDESGQSMQQTIVQDSMAGTSVLGLLPTGTGKSLCYQIPALSRYDKTGALTVVISPLVALMSDQVAGLERRNITSCTTINGMLSMPERKEALDRVRLGDASILLISPEQLRSTSVRRVLDQREIGFWVVDEAHCLSKWGHDFRPDYRYIGRFIREKSEREGLVPPVMCLTATAKPDVVTDITRHFRDKLDIPLKVVDGGSERNNLVFEVIPTTPAQKFHHVHELLSMALPSGSSGGAIVYCATRRSTEELTEFLQAKEMESKHFHGGLSPETKKEVLQGFTDGKLQVITATNAFGMGIDKPDIRLVVHADIPGSLENYLQEAGRAGRDGETARCILFHTPDDVERQFGMSARSRLTQQEIQGVLKALRKLSARDKSGNEDSVVATPGEILNEDDEFLVERDSGTEDTKIRTAVAWLEESVLLTREENIVNVFPSSLLVESLQDARNRLAQNRELKEKYRKQLLEITRALMNASAVEGITTDELRNLVGLSPNGIRGALYDLEKLGVVSNDTALTAYVHKGVQRASTKRLQEAVELECALIEQLRLSAPDMEKGEKSPLHLRLIAQALRDEEVPNPLPERIWRILRSLQFDGWDEDGGRGSLSLRKIDAEQVNVTLQREWSQLKKTAEIRRTAAHRLLEHLLLSLPDGRRGTDILAETTVGKMLQAIQSDIELLNSGNRKFDKLLDRALLWLHEQEVIRLNKGLTVFRSAMTIRLDPDNRGRRFSKADFEPLSLHYEGQVQQIHVMAEFALQGLESMDQAIRLSIDYFSLEQDQFLCRWFPDREKEIGRQMTPASWEDIVESLNDPTQKRIVADNREHTNVLVLAGPGSGKTRVLVHRIAYLIRARRENPRGILALTYNRHSAVEIRQRLEGLIGKDARGVMVLTCDALAMRLVGASFQGRAESRDHDVFEEIMNQAIALLRGEGLEPEEADEQRERLLAGFRWILVDEYQDINETQYALISALAGRTLESEDNKLAVFAVGDDDQNIYAFNGASVRFIRQFGEDYGPVPTYMIGNYRSTGHIINAANTLIGPAAERMKADHPIQVNRARTGEPPGGAWNKLDPVSRGRVQILDAGGDPVSQAQAVMTEFQRLAGCSPDWDWAACAVIARNWKYLDPVRAWCESNSIPVQMGNEEVPGFWRLRETQGLLDFLSNREGVQIDIPGLHSYFNRRPGNHWSSLLEQAVDEYRLETGNDEDVIAGHFIEWLAEWSRSVYRRQKGLLLVTAHGAKGLEFDHVVVLDGGWRRIGQDEDRDAPRRLYYVAMTRARQTLALARFQPRHASEVASQANVSVKSNSVHPNPLLEMLTQSPDVRTRSAVAVPPAGPELSRRYLQLKMRDVDLSYAGRYKETHPVHCAIRDLNPGDPLFLVRSKFRAERWELTDHAGKVVGRLSSKFNCPANMKFRSGTVYAIVTRDQDQGEGDPKYRSLLKCRTWEIVVPELVFEPG